MIFALVLAVAAQDPAPEVPPPVAPVVAPAPPVVETPPPVVETPPPPPPAEQAPNPPPGFPEPTPAERGVLVPSPTATTTTSTTTTTPTQPETSMAIGDYFGWYGAEYAAVVLAGGIYFSGVHKQIQPAPALIGPQFNLDKPDLELLLDPRLDDIIGRPLLKEKVPDLALAGGAAVVVVAAAGIDFLVHEDPHRVHGLVLGGAEAVLATVAVTEALKLSVGRLRPDFRERWLRAACAGNTKAPDDLDCSSVDDGFEVSKEDLTDGMKSFASGHSSSSFAVATFGSLWLGSTLVWGKDRPAWGPAVGALGIGALYTTAGAVAASRISDNRHHPEDVVAGAALGATLGAAAFLVHFDIDGAARHRSWNVIPTTGMGTTGTGTGVAVVGAF